MFFLIYARSFRQRETRPYFLFPVENNDLNIRDFQVYFLYFAFIIKWFLVQTAMIFFFGSLPVFYFLFPVENNDLQIRGCQVFFLYYQRIFCIHNNMVSGLNSHEFFFRVLTDISLFVFCLKQWFKNTWFSWRCCSFYIYQKLFCIHNNMATGLDSHEFFFGSLPISYFLFPV